MFRFQKIKEMQKKFLKDSTNTLVMPKDDAQLSRILSSIDNEEEEKSDPDDVDYFPFVFDEKLNETNQLKNSKISKNKTILIT